MRVPLWVLVVSAGAAVISISCSGTMDSGHDMDMTEQAISTTPLAKTVDHDAVYVVNGGDNSITVIDARSDSVVGIIGIIGATYPHHISLSPDRSKLSVGIPGADFSGGHTGAMAGMKGAVAVVDAITGQLTIARRMMSMNHNAAFSPDGDEIWTGGMMSAGMLYIMDAMTLILTDSLAVGNTPQEVTFAQGGRYAFVCNGGSHNVTVIDRNTKQTVKTIDVDNNPVGAWPGSNGMMYVDNEESKTISAVDTATLLVHHTYNLGFTPGMAASGPQNELWITDSDSGRVVINYMDKDSIITTCRTGAGAHGIIFNADKSKAYVTNQSGNTVSVIDAQTKTALKTIGVGRKPNGLVWRKN